MNLMKMVIKLYSYFIYFTGILIIGISMYYLGKYLLYDRTESCLLILLISFIATLVYANYMEKKVRETAMHTLFNLFAKRAEENTKEGTVNETK